MKVPFDYGKFALWLFLLVVVGFYAMPITTNMPTELATYTLFGGKYGFGTYNTTISPTDGVIRSWTGLVMTDFTGDGIVFQYLTKFGGFQVSVEGFRKLSSPLKRQCSLQDVTLPQKTSMTGKLKPAFNLQSGDSLLLDESALKRYGRTVRLSSYLPFSVEYTSPANETHAFLLSDLYVDVMGILHGYFYGVTIPEEAFKETLYLNSLAEVRVDFIDNEVPEIFFVKICK
jgi:hypothetical protein